MFTEKVIASFWKRVMKQDDGCWTYTSKNPRYSFLSCLANGKRYTAHRFSYELHFGSIPIDKMVCHKCDVPKCVNPSHLFLGTSLDNNRDRDQKGRNHHANKTHCKHGHELSDGNYYLQEKTGWRYCIQCRRNNDKNRTRLKRGTKEFQKFKASNRKYALAYYHRKKLNLGGDVSIP